ncbi:MAG TPA: multiheme c-type cytochrome ExtKL [Anaeromyxobacteraceae bacterium]|nr:multiheme c-type cytochrome ExtKL [Anaeromyxobacteraceae bacterium]
MRPRLAVLLLLAAPLAAAQAPAAKKAKTIDQLAAMFDSARCKQCHGEIYAQWEKSHHARPFMGVAGGLMLIPVVRSSAFQVKSPKEATLKTFPCFKCHLPQAVTHAEDSVAVELAEALFTASDKDKPDKDKAAAKAKVARLQITCIVCHNEKAIAHKLVLGPPQADVIYGSRDLSPHGDPPDRVFKSVKKSAILNQPVFCGQCHGTGPNFEFDYPIQCATLYGSYQHNYLSKGGFQTCQECHMRKVGKVADHTFPPNWDDKESTSKMLADNISLDVQTLGYQWLRKAGALTPMIVVNTKIGNRAGHRIPDG